jgi:hypothetical protein
VHFEIQREIQDVFYMFFNDAPLSNIQLFEMKIFISWEIVGLFNIICISCQFFDTLAPYFRNIKISNFPSFSVQEEISC